MSRGELPLQGDEPWTFIKGLKRIGTNQGIATSQLGGTHIHAMHAGGRFGPSVERLRGQVCQGQLILPSFWGRYMSGGGGGTLGLPGGTPGGYYFRNLVTVVTAILKAVPLPGRHTAATKLLHDSIGTSQVLAKCSLCHHLYRERWKVDKHMSYSA